MSAYRGVDRRRSTGLVPVIDTRRLRVAAAACVTTAAAFGVLEFALPAGSVSGELTIAIATLAATLLASVASACAVLFRVSRDRRAVHLATIAGVVGSSQFLVAAMVGHSERAMAAAALGSLPAAWQLAQLARCPEVDTELGARRVVLPTVGFALGFAALGALFAVPSEAAHVAQVLAWSVAGITVGRAAMRRRRHLLAWLTLIGGGLALSAGLGFASTSEAVTFASALIGLLGALGLGGVMVEVRRAYASQQRDVISAMADAAMATMRAQAVDENQAERLHETRAALAGIGAAATTIARFRDLLEPEQFSELSNGMVNEVARLRTLIEEGATASADDEVELVAAVTPVVVCARSAGMAVTSAMPDGLFVKGSADVVAQVLTALVSNVSHHAPGSPVEIRAHREANAVVVSVADRGPGVAEADCERIFERGVTTGGTGLGLYLARTQLAGIGGTISALPRLGGGAVFTIRLRAIPEVPSAIGPLESARPAAS